ncbi:hypothetical protein B0H13DRAFT_2512652 [Mycena leptocephala]|nr:hypothetical protein B0H13DRAFT_2512652 [Mycena leptocephala]
MYSRVDMVVDMVVDYKGHSERIQLAVTRLGKQHVILGYSWLQKHNLEINWETKELAATHEGLRVTGRLAFSTKLANIEPALREDGLDPFGLIGIPSIPHTGPHAFAAAFTSLFFVRPIEVQKYPQGNEAIEAAGWEPFPTTIKPDDIVFLTGEKPDLARFSGIVNEHVLLVNGDIDFMAPHPKNRPLSLDNARSICSSITTEIWVPAENPMTGIANGPFVSNGTTHPISSITGKSVQTWLLKGSHRHLALWMVLLTNPAHPKLWQIKVLPSC